MQGRTAAGWVIVLMAAAGCSAAGRAGADAAVTVCDATWRDAGRSRDVPVRIRVPAVARPAPVILFSHGLGGTLDAGTAWARAWSAGGFAVVHLQHAGSDAAIWQGERRAADALQGLRAGMSGDQLIARVADVRFVLDQLATRRSEGDCDLRHLDLSRVGMSGHSFGAHTTQAVAGQVFTGGARARASLRDARVRAAVAFSPAPPLAPEQVQRAAFAEITIPFFSITGTRDAVPALNDVSPADRLLPHRYMPPGRKYLLVLDGADHAAFSGNDAPRRMRTRDTHVSDVVTEATLAFWRATLLDDAAARAWLSGDGLQSRLRAGDRLDVR